MTRAMAVLLLVASCAKTTPHIHCTSADQCSLPGRPAVCIDGTCAVASSGCPSGYRFDTRAGGNGQCTPAPSVVDMAAASIDMASDANALTWTALNGGTTADLYGVSDTTAGIWTVGSGVILHTADDGAKWTPQSTGGINATTVEIYRSILAVDDAHLWVSGSQQSQSTTSGVIYSTVDGGSSWVLQSRPTSPTTSIAGDAQDIYAVAGPFVFHATSATSSTVQFVAMPAVAYSIASPGAGAVYAALTGGMVYRSTDRTGHWQPTTADPGGADLMAAWAASATDAWVVGAGGVAFHTNDGASSWQPVATSVSSRLEGIAGAAPDDLVVVGDGGVILHFHDGGMHPEASGVRTALYGVVARGRRDYYAVGANGVILHGQ
jgi:photosystem II stability/assembly factor-like uncharacterized protein